MDDVKKLELGPDRRKVFIVDGFAEDDFLKKAYQGLKELPYYFFDSDRPDTRHIKHLVHHFREEPNPIVTALTEFAQDVFSSLGITPGKVSRRYANFNLFGDYQFAHQDGNQWTALFFMNESWSEDWGGELLLYEDGQDAYAYAVQPKAGRLVIFDGMITHRGGVPSKLCFEPRISLAIKFNR